MFVFVHIFEWMTHIYYVYVLISKKDLNLYIGYTSNLEKRVSQHNKGENKSTKSRRPLELIYFEGHRNQQDALRREAYFKTSSGKRTLNLMLRETLKTFEQNPEQPSDHR